VVEILRLKFAHFGVPWSDAPGGVMRSVVGHVRYRIVNNI
jgi:hypothetical protein